MKAQNATKSGSSAISTLFDDLRQTAAKHRSLMSMLSALLISFLCGIVFYLYVLPVYHNGTGAEQRILEENAAMSEDVSARLTEIRSSLEAIEQTASETKELTSDPVLSKDIDSVRDVLSSFGSDLDTYQNSAEGNSQELLDQIDTLSSRIETTDKKLEGIGDAAQSGFSETQAMQNTANTMLLEKLGALSDEQSAGRAALESSLRSSFESVVDLAVTSGNTAVTNAQQDLAERLTALDTQSASILTQTGSLSEQSVQQASAQALLSQNSADTLSSQILENRQLTSDLSAKIGSSTENVTQNLETWMDARFAQLEEKLESTSSDARSEADAGRSMIAAALRSKGISVGDDADFAEMAELIRSIDTSSESPADDENKSGTDPEETDAGLETDSENSDS